MCHDSGANCSECENVPSEKYVIVFGLNKYSNLMSHTGAHMLVIHMLHKRSFNKQLNMHFHL